MHRVLILGGGFGGIATAVALRARLETEDEVVLVERRPTFMMGLRKNWALLGESAIGEGEPFTQDSDFSAKLGSGQKSITGAGRMQLAAHDNHFAGDE